MVILPQYYIFLFESKIGCLTYKRQPIYILCFCTVQSTHLGIEAYRRHWSHLIHLEGHGQP